MATEQLSLVAELGVAFAAFLAIFLVLARAEARFSPPDGVRVRVILLTSLFLVLAACIPLVLELFPLDRSLLWRIASSSALAGFLTVAANIAWHQFSMSAADQAALGTFNSIVSWSLAGAAGSAFTLNTLGLLGGPDAGLYVGALVCLLGVCTSNFITVAFQRLL